MTALAGYLLQPAYIKVVGYQFAYATYLNTVLLSTPSMNGWIIMVHII